ncbi:HAD family hydrolase [Alicyclobacillus tolerans]|uniref:HAD family hydrolase n=1 Tax=Alicyclobacillus tolerans TaxID=90970 RepID=UPI001F3BDA36|nr:HAD family hydrolase [Alicyclobacillus tolerans]MCF8567223.1 HAD family hydrolase [Alicyclobacillus tolerans]
MFQAIFFDLDHTLVDTRRQYHLGLTQALEQIYGFVPEGFIPRFMHHNDELWPEYDKRRLSMEDLRIERFVRAWRDLGQEKTSVEAAHFHKVYADTLKDTLMVFPGTLEMLDRLRNDYKLGIVTNGSPDFQNIKMKATGLADYFSPQAVVVSEDIGMAKPHPSVYQAACERVGIEASRALMVGDNYANDVAGARACGLSAVWYCPDEVIEAKSVMKPPVEAALHTPKELLRKIEELDGRGGLTL